MPIADFDQSQREALISLLIVATYGDDHLSIVEMESYESMIQALPWDSGTSLEIFQDEATAEARDAHEAGTAEDFIWEKAEIFDSPAAKATALDLFTRLLDSDGTTDEEGELVAVAREALA